MGEETDVSVDHASSDDSEIEPTEPKLYRVSDATGVMEITEVATGRFEQEQLDVSVRYKNYIATLVHDDAHILLRAISMEISMTQHTFTYIENDCS